ncbi:PH domain-containing protein [Actinomadura barringtoniae]|uniref:PH domain-containing protein n=1 Tax=Actinomadura barringtoniae TaxID=1427535 RepID=A0A939TD98_9ACTN|nr:PH domain-containing protein [Actinomadura barringtoniae]MBO2452080.1 PH domain-containing protein [Actinomadura barringtoniae]
MLKFRSTAARVGAWTWMVFAALNLVDIVVRGRDTTALVMAALLIFGCGLAFVLGLRPIILGDDSGVTLRNPLRDVRVPWAAVRKIEDKDAIVVRYRGTDGAERASRAWVLQTSPRARAKAEARARADAKKVPGSAADHLAGRTPTQYAAQQLTEMGDRQRPTKGKPGNPAAAAEKDAQKTAEAQLGKTSGTVAWSPAAVLALGIPGAFLLATVIIALTA